MAGATNIQAINCPLCSFTFLPVGDACHSGCPMAGNCHMICCPNCGYEMVDVSRSRVAGWLRKLWPQAGQPTATPRPQGAVRQPLLLSQAPLRVNLVIDTLDGLAPRIQARFSVLGLLPGARIQLLQRRPAPIVRIGETELAVGLELLECVRVHEG